MSTKPRSIGDILQEFAQHRQLMQQELQKVIVGQNDVIEQLFAAIFTRGHCLLEGVPGLGQDPDGQHAVADPGRGLSNGSSSRPT